MRNPKAACHGLIYLEVNAVPAKFANRLSLLDALPSHPEGQNAIASFLTLRSSLHLPFVLMFRHSRTRRRIILIARLSRILPF